MLLGNYFISAWRNILRYKLFSVINIFGLAIGIAACLFIFLFIRNELSFDDWVPNADNIYRVNYSNFYQNRSDVLSVRAPGIAKTALEERFPEIEEATRFYPLEPVFSLRGEDFKELAWVADNNFLKVFELNLLEGDRSSALNELNNIIISTKVAKKFFNEQPPIGQVIKVKHRFSTDDYVVTGVFEDLPENTEFEFDIIFPLDANVYQNEPAVESGWFNLWGFLYLKLKDGANPKIISDQLDDLVAKNVPVIDERSPNEVIELSITNVKDIRLHSGGRDGSFNPTGSITQVYTFSFVAFLILMIACINFMNLSTARSIQRANEVSMRKVLGANRKQLIKQFLGENILLAFIGLVFAMAIVEVGLPFFNNLTDLTLNVEYIHDPQLILFGLLLVCIIGVFAGFYPAFYLTAFRPSEILSSGTNKNHKKSVGIRKGLTIFQFSISITLIISTAVVYSQNHYALNKDLGFDKDNKLIVRNIGRGYSKEYRAAMMEEIKKLPDVNKVSLSILVPTDVAGWHTEYNVKGAGNTEKQAITQFPIDHNYFGVYDIPILAGRDFDGNRENDIMNVPMPGGGSDVIDEQINQIVPVILNQSAVRQLSLGSPNQALNQLIEGEGVNYQVIGVVSDTHFNSLKSSYQSFVYLIYPDLLFNLTVDYNEDTNTALLQKNIAAIWKSFLPNIEFSYDFIDDMIAAQYKLETKQSNILFVFSILTVIIACLGLYGLAAFTIEQRTLEVAIRKVHGARVWDVIKLLLVQFSMPVLLSNIIAWPIAWYVMSDYLNGFVFRVELGVSYFIGTGILALIIAWLTTTYHAYRAAQTCPAITLRA